MIQELTIDAQREGGGVYEDLSPHTAHILRKKNKIKLEGKQKGRTTELTQPCKLMQAQAQITNSTSSSSA